MLALTACGPSTTKTTASSDSAPKAESCESAYVDWLYVSAGVKCDAAKEVATAIFMGDDGNERTSFTKDDFWPLPTVRMPGVGYLPTRVLHAWRCRYRTRRSSYDAAWFDANGAPRLVYATCRLGARVVEMTTAIDERANHRYS